MRNDLASDVMTRTTLNIDQTVLRGVRRLASSEGKTLAQVVSELLAMALAAQKRHTPADKLSWKTKSMRARVDLEDKEAVYAALERG